MQSCDHYKSRVLISEITFTVYARYYIHYVRISGELESSKANEQCLCAARLLTGARILLEIDGCVMQ